MPLFSFFPSSFFSTCLLLATSSALRPTSFLAYASSSARHHSHSTTTRLNMQVIRSDSIGGRGVTFIPSSGRYTNVVIWMHGLGDTAEGWANSIAGLGLVGTKIILPTANNTSITINNGFPMPGWSDIYGLDMNSKEDKQGFDYSAERINRIIQQELDQGIPAEKMIIGGFSQGGALALHVSLRSSHALGGCVALSTWVPFHQEYPAALSPAAAQLKVLQIHGDEDMVVAYPWGKKSNDLLKTMLSFPPPQFLTIEGMGHGADNDELLAVKKFITNILEN